MKEESHEGIDLGRFPRVRLGVVRTPIEALPRLSAALGGPVLWVKRDDLTGLAFGGNKVRQLEFQLGEAVAAGADTVLVTGAVQSNFVRVAVAAARRVGLEPVVQLEARVPTADRTYRESGNVLLDRLFGARIHTFPEGEDEPAADAALDGIASELRREGRRPFVIRLAPGHPPVGALGYVLAASELVEQTHALGSRFDAVVVGTGGGNTHAGLLVGLRLAGDATPVHGMCVRRDARSQLRRVCDACRRLEGLLGIDPIVTDGDVVVSDAAFGEGYGRVSRDVREALLLAARTEGLVLDPVYTAKAMAGLIAGVRDGSYTDGSRVCFVHTGGQPALFAYGDLLGELGPS